MSPAVAVVVAAAAAAGAVLVVTGGRSASPRLSRLSRFGAIGLDAGRVVPGRSSGGSLDSAVARPGHAPGGQPRVDATAGLMEGGAADARLRLTAAAMAGLGLAVVMGGVVGIVSGVSAAAAAYVVVGRLEPRAVRERRERVARDVPAAASLLAAAVSAGATPVAAVELVAMAIGGPLGQDLYRLAASARLGGDFPLVSANLTPDPVARLSRVMARAVATGAPLAAALDRLAADLYAERRFEVDRRARSVGVRAAAPLGLCFLPGFLLIGVIPVVAGIASTVLGRVL